MQSYTASIFLGQVLFPDTRDLAGNTGGSTLSHMELTAGGGKHKSDYTNGGHIIGSMRLCASLSKKETSEQIPRGEGVSNTEPGSQQLTHQLSLNNLTGKGF